MYLFKTDVNCFHYLYQDAETFHQLAKKSSGFDATRLFRTAMMLYIISLEALANRALNAFVNEPEKDFFLEKEDKFSLEDKYYILPILVNGKGAPTFNTGAYLWSHFKELIRIRNDFLHPKHKRTAYCKAITTHTWEPFDWKEIPSDAGFDENAIIYRQTEIPKDPYAIQPAHLGVVKKTVDDSVDELIKLLQGRMTRKWLHDDTMTLFYPKGAKINDIPKNE